MTAFMNSYSYPKYGELKEEIEKMEIKDIGAVIEGIG